MMKRLAATALTLLLSTLCGGLFALAGMPAAWLMGSMTAVAGGALGGLTLRLPSPLGTAAFVLLGISMGAGVTPDTLHQMASWPLSMALLAGSVMACLYACSAWLERVHRWDPATARYAAVPGALGAVLVLAAESRADLPRVALAQSLRLFVLVAAMPWLLELVSSTPGLPPRPALSDPADALPELALLVGVSAVAGLLFQRLRVPGGVLLGAMLGSALLHGSGLVDHRLPNWLLNAGFVVTGAMIGSRFAGVTLASLRAALRPSLESVALALVLSSAFAWAGGWLLGLPFGQLWLAYAPGGVEAMTIVAFVLGLDTAFVGTHHVVRFAGLGFLARWWQPRRG